jgi:2-oxoglutarate ferredoxin oxidoreductase subunit delta
MLQTKDKMSRREFLRGSLPKNPGKLLIDREKCTGCTLCVIDCPTKALVIHPGDEKDSYQLLFQQEVCNACGLCEKSCPEHCLKFIDRELAEDESGRETKVIFEDNLSRCIRCDTPLFPRSMVRKLEAKIFTKKGSTWELNLCPSCRTATPLFTSTPFPPQEGKGAGGPPATDAAKKA